MQDVKREILDIMIELSEENAYFVHTDYDNEVLEREGAEGIEGRPFPTGMRNMKIIVDELAEDGFINIEAEYINGGEAISIPAKGLYYKEELAKMEKEKKSSRRHDYRVALFSFVGGGICGFLTSLVFWALAN